MQVLRVAAHQVAVRRQVVRQAGEHRSLGRTVEIDGHVPTEYHVEVGANAPGRRRSQVDAAKGHHGSQRRCDPVEAVAAPIRLKVFGALARRYLGDGDLVVYGLFGRREYVGVEIGCEDANIPAGEGTQGVGQGHGDGPWLVPHRASGAPDTYLARGPGADALQELGDHALAHEGEVMRLAEEAGLVGGDAVDELAPLFASLLCGDVGQILGERGEAEGAES